MRQGNFSKVLTRTDVHTARSLYLEGWSLQQIANQFGVTKQAIWKLLRRRDVPMHRARPTRDEHGHFTGSTGGKHADPVNREERDEAGCIVTLHEQRTGERGSLHIPGKRLDAMRNLAAMIDNAKGDWRVLCYSTPRSILGDLQGLRVDVSERADGKDPYGFTQFPEVNVLAAIGRLDLLDPSLDRAGDEERQRMKRRRKR
jgi:hypothetical protein